MAPLLEMRGITKRYGTTIACEGVDLVVRRGTVHALLGENGAGKSTLVRAIYGAVIPDAGEIVFDGRRVAEHSPAKARRLGIEMVHQHFALFETATVAENVALCTEGPLNLPALSARIEAAAKRHGLAVDPGRRVGDLSMGERQRVELLRCLMREPRLLILDEPTSVLTPAAAETLFATLRAFAARGGGVLYISHKLAEVRALCDEVTVLRAGRVAGRPGPRHTSERELATLMVGSDVPTPRRGRRTPGRTVLEVAGLDAAPLGVAGWRLRDVALTVREGEVVGIAGISGNGQSELCACLSGEAPTALDMVRLDGEPVGHLGAAARRDRGVAHVPEERLGRGAVPGHSLALNGLLTGHRRGLVRVGLVRWAATMAFAKRIVRKHGVRAGGADARAESLSGGNLQKFIVGRELALAPRLLLVAQPTWGVDVGSAAGVRQALLDLANGGAGVLVVSEDIDELLELCDAIHVMTAGSLLPALRGVAMTREAIGLAMAGSASPEDGHSLPEAPAEAMAHAG